MGGPCGLDLELGLCWILSYLTRLKISAANLWTPLFTVSALLYRVKGKRWGFLIYEGWCPSIVSWVVGFECIVSWVMSPECGLALCCTQCIVGLWVGHMDVWLTCRVTALEVPTNSMGARV